MKRFFRKSNRSANPHSVQGNREAHFQGCFQQLEDRRLLTVYVVDTLMDDMSGVEDGLISLREAMIAAENNLGFGDASAGDVAGDLILFNDSLSGQTIVLTNGEFNISDDLHVGGDTRVVINADSDSRIFNIDGNEKYLFTNLELTRGRALAQGGAISMDGGGVLLLTDILFSENIALGQGGALYSNDSEVIIIASSFNQNRASGENGSGGAIYNNGGHFTLATSKILANGTVLSGGGIVVNNAMARISQTDFRNNTAGDGGAVAILGESYFVITASSIVGNTAVVNGGGFWVQAGESRVVIKENSSLFNNSANGDAANQGGGAIYNGGALVRILESDITMNTATGENGAGGGILSVGGILNVRYSQISGNQATVFGGGIEVIDGYAKLEESVLGEFAEIGGNVSGLDGGGLHISGVEGSTVDFDGIDVLGNFAARDGGGAWIQANSLFIVDNSSRFQFNQAASDVNGGGGIFNLGGTIVIDNSQFFQNSASGENGLGGAIHSLGGVVTATNNSSFVFNNAQRGGGGISMLGGQLNLTDSTVSNNFAEGGDGGGIYVAVDGEAIVDNSQVSANTAMRGGGIGGFDSRVVVKNDSHVVGNRAQSPAEGAGIGGGIYTQGGLLRILDSAITDNEALSFNPGEALGGGIANLSGIVNLRNSAVISNGVNGNGGGIHIMAGTVSIQNTVIGGVGPSDGNFAIHGAGVYFDALAMASIVGGSITENVASMHGGGIFNHPTSNLQITEGTFISRNTADVGGGIYNSGLMSMIDVILSQNIAGTGGGLSNQPAAIAVIDTVDIDGNQSSFVGGGVDNSGIVNFTNQVDIRNNVADVTGGGVFTENIGLSIFNDVTFSNNIPDDTNN